MRKSFIRGYATRYLDNAAKNNGKCNYGFMNELVQEASSVTDMLQITRSDIKNEAAKIVAERRKVSPELTGTTSSKTIDEPLDADAPPGDVLQVSAGIDLLAHAAAYPQPQPPKVSTTINEPLDGFLGDVLQVSVGIHLLSQLLCGTSQVARKI